MPTIKQLENSFFKLILSLVIIVIVINFYADTTPIIVEAGNEINATNSPLSSFFAGDSSVITIIMISLALIIISIMLSKNRKD